MAYLTAEDYKMHIQDVNLQQIIQSNEGIRERANILAIAQARSYLVQKFDIDAELIKTGEARGAELLSNIVDMALYHLHTAISPRNIPELREKRYENALMWLNMCAKGELSPALAQYEIRQGKRIRFGGNVKNKNQY
jgi:phage gp36-like protein